MMPSLYPDRPVPRIDYERMNREHPKLKAALTRAERAADPRKIAEACERAVLVWNKVGAWPDDWARWRNALEDAWYSFSRSDAFDDDLYDNGGQLAAYFRRVAFHFDV